MVSYGLIWSQRVLDGLIWSQMVSDGLRWSQMVSDFLGWSVLVDFDYHKMVLKSWIGRTDGSPGVRRYRAPYGANKMQGEKLEI